MPLKLPSLRKAICHISRNSALLSSLAVIPTDKEGSDLYGMSFVYPNRWQNSSLHSN